MDIRQLRYFICIAEMGSVSAAADRLGVAQPSLSQHVKNLEAELGVELLVRSSRGVCVTESGRKLVAHANRVIRVLDLGISELKARSGVPRGPVSIGLPSSACNVLSVALAEEVRAQLPEVILRVMDAMSGHVQDWLTEGTIDLGILYDVHEVRHLQRTPMLHEDLYLVAAPEDWPHPTSPAGISEVTATFAECAALDLILPHRTHGLRESIERFSAARGLSLNVIIEMDALFHLKALVARSAGFTFLAPGAVVAEVRERKLVLVPVRDAIMRRTVYLVRNPVRPVTKAALEVERILTGLIVDLVRSGIWQGELIS